jgi:hypothetical protein
VREEAGVRGSGPAPSTHQTGCVNTWPLHQEWSP